MWKHKTLSTELSLTILVLISKLNVSTQDIILFKLLWKIIEAVIYILVNMDIHFHGVLHGFCARQRTRTSIMEIKMDQDLSSIK